MRTMHLIHGERCRILENYRGYLKRKFDKILIGLQQHSYPNHDEGVVTNFNST